MSLSVYDANMVERLLDYPGCVVAMRAAMIALSAAEKPQPQRQILEIDPGKLFGVMPGSLAPAGLFGAKLVSVFPDPAREGRSRHVGVVVAYDAVTGAMKCLADAAAVTEIRTACATAAATDTLARADARVLAVFGLGAQARSHLRALSPVRGFDRILLWGREIGRARARAAELGEELGLAITPVAEAREAAGAADVLCMVTSAQEPVVLGAWVKSGAHVNLVGSSVLGPVEVDSALVARGRYVADYRPSVMAQASELEVARRAGAVDDHHVVGEIGQVYAGHLEGRQAADQITIYKSLGHVAQDLAAVAYLHERAGQERP